ncbi:protein kinase domain-containing protein [Nocardia fluminea]|uniref:protein kinase domain-containing protein n=1 Tax=Nocardia fluminea TaxID=134984 RepID=UPI0034155C50
MNGDDPLQTRSEEVSPVTVELDAAGFEDAVEIGRGGFGVVYRCWQPRLDRMVAVKVSTADLDADNQARFVREQRAMGRLTGLPNIVTVLEVGTTSSGRPYLVMPYYPRDSLDAWIRKNGPLPVEGVLDIGVKIAGAVAAAHRLDIVHRDVKPGNILLTEYGEPALADFGIAHIGGGFRTAAGTLTGSPAFTAPEVLEGEVPTPAADVYGLGATLFCALTGHAAFERRSGENMVTQFLRITTQPVPDLREMAIPGEVSALVESAMSRDPKRRPSAAALEESLRQARQLLGFPSGEMASEGEIPLVHRGRESLTGGGIRPSAAVGWSDQGNLPLELTSFIARRRELAEVKNLLAASRLVTLTGIGGVGKTRLALRAASKARRDFIGGVWWIELADVSDPALLVGVVAAALGVRDVPGAPLVEVVARFIGSRDVLLILDNCEQVVEAVAELDETLLRACPGLRLLVTSRESLNIPGEVLLRVPPLTVPDPAREPEIREMPRFDAVALFADRAASAVPGFELDEDNKAAVARICTRLDGLPLAIELAAARMRTMSTAQILERLTDRFALLTRGRRTAPTRQQTLRWCIDWSHALCTAAEQRMWAQLSVFAGSFELDAAEQICGADATPQDPLDVLSSLADKSILIREESDSVVRFRMLETVREYGREKLRESGEDKGLRRRHRDWYQRLALDAEAEWISDRQLDWIARLERELPNFREALEFSLSEDGEDAAAAGLRTAAALFQFWAFRGMFGEARSWLDRVIDHSGPQPPSERVKALCVGACMAAALEDFESARVLLEQGRILARQAFAHAVTPAIEGRIEHTAGFLAIMRGDAAAACDSLIQAVEMLRSHGPCDILVSALAGTGWAYEMRGDMARSAECYGQVVAITEARGELLYRLIALRGSGVVAWRRNERDRARQLLEHALRVSARAHSPVIIAYALEALAWTTADRSAEHAAILMGAAQRIWPSGAREGVLLPPTATFHDECERISRSALGNRRFDAAFQRGQMMDTDASVAYALGERASDTSPASVNLTKRERQVADLVAQGLSNKQVAAELVISHRTAQGHVEHILTKLGFNSRAQIAAWVVGEAENRNS